MQPFFNINLFILYLLFQNSENDSSSVKAETGMSDSMIDAESEVFNESLKFNLNVI